jgi:hypothetical protein
MNATLAILARRSAVRNTSTSPDGAGYRTPVDGAAVNAATIGLGTGPLHVRLAGATNIARYHGVDPDPHAVRLDATEIAPSARVLVEWLRQSGLWAKGAHLTFRQLMEIERPPSTATQ